MSEEFLKSLADHNLSVSEFLDLRDAWERLSWADRSALVRAESEE